MYLKVLHCFLVWSTRRHILAVKCLSSDVDGISRAACLLLGDLFLKYGSHRRCALIEESCRGQML